MPEPTDPKADLSPAILRQSRRWWLAPLVLGVVLAVIALLLADFRPVVSRFYSVF